MSKIYIIKNLSTWMMDEIKAFAPRTKFDLLLLRRADDSYRKELIVLEKMGIRVFEKPKGNRFFLKKLMFSISFFIRHINKFRPNYNGVIGLKSIIWFLVIDITMFDKSSKLHAQFATQSAIFSLMIKEFYKNQPEFSFTFHAYDIYFKNRWMQTLVKKCKWAFSISEYNIDYVSKQYIKSDKIILSRLGVFKQQVKRPIVQNKSVISFGLMSWFVEKKGIMYLLHAVNKIKQSGIDDFQLLLAGDGPLKNQILSFIEEYKLKEMVIYLGVLRDEDKVNFFRQLDAFVLPSVSVKNDMDGIPVVLMEAVSFGLPIISTQISGIPEICINNFNGKLIPEKETEPLKNALLEFRNREKLKEYSNNALEIIKLYDIEINSKQKIKRLEW